MEEQNDDGEGRLIRAREVLADSGHGHRVDPSVQNIFFAPPAHRMYLHFSDIFGKALEIPVGGQMSSNNLAMRGPFHLKIFFYGDVMYI